MKCDEFVGRIDRSRRERDGKERDVRCDRCRSSRFARLSRPSPRASTTDECTHQSHRIHSTRVRACIRARDGRGRRCIHTVIPYILPRNTRVFDSYHHRPCMFYKTCMHDRFVPRIETQYVRTHAAVVWFGRHTRHDTHTHTSLFHSNTYILSEKYSIHYIQKSTSSTRRQSITHGAHSSTRRRARDWRRASDDDVGERTNERVRRRLRFRRNGTRPRVIHARIIGVGKIHWPRRKSQRARNSFTHSLIHSVR